MLILALLLTLAVKAEIMWKRPARLFRSEATRMCRQKKAPRKAGPLAFPAEPSAYAAAVSTNSSGSASNSFLQLSEQKKYFLPANCVWNSLPFSSTFIPQTGSVVMIPPVQDSCLTPLPSKNLSVPASAKYLIPCALQARNSHLRKIPQENSSTPVHIVPTPFLEQRAPRPSAKVKREVPQEGRLAFKSLY
jgi:hypothetical protein